MKLKKGDRVVVVAGKCRGQSGAITRVLPKKNLVVIDGINVVKRHRRATTRGGKGQIIDRSMPIHASNVMIADPRDGKPTRIRVMRDKNGIRRVATRSGEVLK